MGDESARARAQGVLDAHAELSRQYTRLGLPTSELVSSCLHQSASEIVSLSVGTRDTTTLVTPGLEQAARNLENVTGITTSMLNQYADIVVEESNRVSYHPDYLMTHSNRLEAMGGLRERLATWEAAPNGSAVFVKRLANFAIVPVVDMLCKAHLFHNRRYMEYSQLQMAVAQLRDRKKKLRPSGRKRADLLAFLLRDDVMFTSETLHALYPADSGAHSPDAPDGLIRWVPKRGLLPTVRTRSGQQDALRNRFQGYMYAS